MPNYNLKCNKCGHNWSDFMSLSERQNAKCPKCGNIAETNWNIKSGSVIIKGNGFYQESTVR